MAARGLDIPAVDWIVQFDPPDDPRDYIHRVGRTARAGKAGKSLLFLMESELGFLRYLADARVPLNEYNFPQDRIANVQSQVRSYFSSTNSVNVLLFTSLQLEKLLAKNYYLHQSARDGYRSYLQSYASYSLKKIFDVKKLDLVKVGKAFGFSVPPRVNVNMGDRSLETYQKRKREGLHGETESESEREAEEGDRQARPQRMGRGSGKERRREQLGQKNVDKEVYRKDKVRRVDGEGKQWGR